MKKILLVFLSIVAFTTVKAQYIPNGGFEDWTKIVVSEEAYQWNTGYATQYTYNIIPATLKAVQSHTGDYALRLNNYVQGVDSLFSYAICGGLITNIDNPNAVVYTGGFPVTSMPLKINGYFKDSIPIYTWRDTANFFISFKKNGVVVYDTIYPLLGIHANYTLLSFNIAPPKAVPIPDSCIIGITSTSPYYVRSQSKLLFDSLWFSGSSDIIPNSGFEIWEEFGDETPDYWITHNQVPHSLILKDAMVTPSTVAHSGNLAARIESMTTGAEVKGLLQSDQTGFPAIFRPIQLTGFYKFSHKTSDVAQIKVTLFSATDSINTFTTTLPVAANYSPFSINLNYTSGIDITRVKITAVTTTNYNVTGYHGEVGSVLYLDDIDFVTPCDTFTLPDVYAPTPLCSGGNTLAVTGTWDSYLWSNGAITPTITNLSTGTYNVTVKSGVCSFTDSFTVPANTIIGLPTATTPQSFCGSATIANLSVTNGTNGTNIDWYDTITGGNVLPGSTALINGATYYAQSRNSSTGCISGRRAVKDTIYALPTATVSGSKTLCPGSSTDISIVLTGASPWNLTYTDGSSPVNVNGQVKDTLILNVSPSSAKTYTVTSVSDVHCTGTSSGNAIIDISTLPVTSDISGNTNLECSASGEVYSVDPNPANKFIWSVPSDVTIITDTSAIGVNSIQVNFGTTSANISVYQINEDGCAGSSKSLAFNLTGCPFGADFIADATDVCPNDTVLFTSTSIGTKPTTTYAWNFGTDASPLSATGIGPHKVVYSTSGRKTVELTISDGVIDTTTTKTDYISVRTLPLIEITDAKSCGYGEIVFTATTPDGSSIEFSSDNGVTVDGSDDLSPFQYAPVINSEDTIYVVARAISNIGCVGEWSDSVRGVSYPLPVTGSIQTDGSRVDGYLGVYCIGDNDTYSVNPADAPGYQWFIADLDIIREDNEISVTWNTINGSHIISVAASSDEGCLGEPSLDSVYISAPSVDIGDSIVNICKGSSHTFSTDTLFTTYLWNDGSTGQQIVVSTVDTVSVLVTDKDGCKASDTAIVVVLASPVLNLGNDTIICDEAGYVLNAGDFASYSWSTGDKGSSITVYPGIQAITLTVTNDDGCKDIDTINIMECSESLLGDIANVITPNDDNIHDTWVIKNIGLYPDAKIEIFDRWGRRVYLKEHGYHDDWGGTFNGKALPMDNYYYIIDLLGDGNQIIKGNIAIVK